MKKIIFAALLLASLFVPLASQAADSPAVLVKNIYLWKNSSAATSGVSAHILLDQAYCGGLTTLAILDGTNTNAYSFERFINVLTAAHLTSKRVVIRTGSSCTDLVGVITQP
jgi:hypothetical protein